MMARGKQHPGARRDGIAQAACTCWQGNRRATTCITCLHWRRLQAHLHTMREGLRALAAEGV